MQRLFFALIHAWQHRQTLRYQTLYLKTCCSFQWDQFTAYKVVILDFDGVLASHGAIELSSEVAAWLTQGVTQCQIYILSNQPLPARIAYFQKHFPTVTFWVAAQKKPYPAAIHDIVAREGIQSTQAILLDDRLLTGVLAAALAGIQGVLITQPTINWRHNFLKEGSFALLRRLETVLLRFMVCF